MPDLSSWTLSRGALFCCATLIMLLAACVCDVDPEKVDVTPECERRPASATITIHAVLGGIRPLGAPKQIRVRGSRKADETVCFADGGELGFTFTLEGDATKDQATPPLAYGAWEFAVQPLSGGDQPATLPTAKILNPGTAYTLTLRGDADGTLVVPITP